MAMSLVGNITYINQNSLSQATQFANAQARPDILQDINLNEYEQKMREIEEVKPAQSASEIDPDGQNKQDAQQNDNSENENSESNAETLADSQTQNIDFEHIHSGMLNISV